MSPRVVLSLVLMAALFGLAGCNAPGKPTPSDIVRRPTDILDPVVLYSQNCCRMSWRRRQIRAGAAYRRSRVPRCGRR